MTIRGAYVHARLAFAGVTPLAALAAFSTPTLGTAVRQTFIAGQR
jgi:hypothetical protein